MQKNNSLEKTLMLGKIEGRRRRRRQDEMVGWHHRLNGHEFEQSLGDGEGQGSLACCRPLLRKESDTPEWLNSNNNKEMYPSCCVWRPSPTHMTRTLGLGCPVNTPARSSWELLLSFHGISDFHNLKSDVEDSYSLNCDCTYIAYI